MSEFTFIHIPRNGGTSIKRVINNLGISRTVAHDRHVWSKNIYMPPIHSEHVDGPVDNKMKTEVEVPYSPENIQKLVIHKTRCSDVVGKAIVIIRDPIDRVKSLYKYWKYGGEKGRARKEKRGKTKEDLIEEETREERKTTSTFIEMFASNVLSDETTNSGIFCHEYLCPQSYWVNVDIEDSTSLSSLIVIPYSRNISDEIDHEDYLDNSDIVSAMYNIINSSKTIKEKDREMFKRNHVELTEMRLNECNHESRKENEAEIFTESELAFFKNHYKKDYDMIAKLKL